MALAQWPFFSLTTNAWQFCGLLLPCSHWLEPRAYSPPAAQLPADAHDTDKTLAVPPPLRAAVPGTSMAWPHRPFRSAATNPSSVNDAPR